MPEAVVCNSVNAGADAFSYGFPLGKRFAAPCVASSLVKEKDTVCTGSVHPLSRATHSSADFFSFSIYCIICCLFMVFFSPFQSSFVYNVSM